MLCVPMLVTLQETYALLSSLSLISCILSAEDVTQAERCQIHRIRES